MAKQKSTPPAVTPPRAPAVPPCDNCDGTGVCPEQCGGDAECEVCNATGECPHCDGSGESSNG